MATRAELNISKNCLKGPPRSHSGKKLEGIQCLRAGITVRPRSAQACPHFPEAPPTRGSTVLPAWGVRWPSAGLTEWLEGKQENPKASAKSPKPVVSSQLRRPQKQSSLRTAMARGAEAPTALSNAHRVLEFELRKHLCPPAEITEGFPFIIQLFCR